MDQMFTFCDNVMYGPNVYYAKCMDQITFCDNVMYGPNGYFLW